MNDTMKVGPKTHIFELHNHNWDDTVLDRTEDVTPESRAYILAERDEQRQRYQRALNYEQKTVQQIIDRVRVIEVIRWEEFSETTGRVWLCERTALVED